MIIEYADLKKHRRNVVMVDGGFDPLHAGHIEYLKRASQLGLPLLCNIASGEYMASKRKEFMPETKRAVLIDSIRYVSFTHINKKTTAAILRELEPRYYVKGKDWKGRLPKEEMDVCRERDIQIVYLDTVSNSSTQILSDYFSSGETMRKQVHTFEEFVTNQRPVESNAYDNAYFSEDWRGSEHTYKIEARREIEGKNPLLIREVFHPSKVLDMGCGPGALMYLLYELGVIADGIDFSPNSKIMAPVEVRDRIITGSVTEQIVPDNSYDLVICRETLEHLTVLQVQRAVQCICRASSKYIYVTTRFHPEPAEFLSITDQPDVDPTHITLLTKNFLRLLFVLEGCCSRPDLEARMDWLSKGRVLVFEKLQDIPI